MTQPRAINASNFFKFFDIVTGISNTPGTSMTLTRLFLGNKFFALLKRPKEMCLHNCACKWWA